MLGILAIQDNTVVIAAFLNTLVPRNRIIRSPLVINSNVSYYTHSRYNQKETTCFANSHISATRIARKEGSRRRKTNKHTEKLYSAIDNVANLPHIFFFDPLRFHHSTISNDQHLSLRGRNSRSIESFVR